MKKGMYSKIVNGSWVWKPYICPQSYSCMAFFGQSLQQKKVGLHGKMLTTTHVTYILIMYIQNGAFLCKISKSPDIRFMALRLTQKNLKTLHLSNLGDGLAKPPLLIFSKDNKKLPIKVNKTPEGSVGGGFSRSLTNVKDF